MRGAVPAVKVLDLLFEGFVVAHPAAVALRVGGLEGQVGPVVEAEAELEGFALELRHGQVGPGWVQDVDDGVALEDPVRVREVLAEELLQLENRVEEPGQVADPHHLALVFLLAEDHVEDGLVAVVVDLFAPPAAVVVRFRVVAQLLDDRFGAREQRPHVGHGTHDQTRIQKLLPSRRPWVRTGRDGVVGVAAKHIFGQRRRRERPACHGVDLVRPTPFAGAEDDGLLYAFDFRGSAHALFDPLVGLGVDPVVAVDEEVLVKLEPDVVAVHHQYEVLIVFRPQVAQVFENPGYLQQMASTPSHTLRHTLVQVFSPSCDYRGGVTEYRAGEEGFAQVDILLGRGYEDVKGLVWWGDRLVGSRGFIAARGGIDGPRGRGGG